MSDKKEKLIKINADQKIRIKAISDEEREFHNRKLIDMVDRIEVRRQTRERQRQQVGRFRTQSGEVVCGSLSEAEKQAVQSGNDAEIRRIARLKQRAIQMERERQWSDKISTFEGLRKLKGHR